MPPQRSARAVVAERLRAAATTEPGRLQIIGAVLALLVVAFGAVTAFEINDRATAANDVVERSQPLSADAADIYRSLADADAAAASGASPNGMTSPIAVHDRKPPLSCQRPTSSNGGIKRPIRLASAIAACQRR